MQRERDGEGVVRKGVLTAGRAAAFVARCLWPRASPWPRATAAAWAAAGAVSIGFSVFNVARSPWWQYDMVEVLAWLSHWTGVGVSPYGATSLTVDYPPHGFVALSWLAVLSPTQTLAFFPYVNGALAALASWQIATWFPELIGENLNARERLALTGMIAATRSVRRAILTGQTVLFSVLLFVVAMRLARRRPVVAGICFAIAAYKLNMAAGFGLALILLGHWPVIVIAGAAVYSMTFMFAASVQLPLLVVVGQWARDFAAVYSGASFLPGATGIRTILTTWLPYSTGDWAYALVALSALVLLCRLAYAAPPSARQRGLVVCGALLWAMFSLTHQRYNALLLVPGLWMMHWRSHALIGHNVLRWLVPSALLAILIATVPAELAEWVTALAAPWPADVRGWFSGTASFVWREGVRIVVATSFALVLRGLVRLRREGSAAVPPAGL